MNKTLKEKLIKKCEESKELAPSLYNQRWVEKAATEGWNQLVKNIEKIDPKLAEAARRQQDCNVLAIIYYTSFENALNTFFSQVMDDGLTNVQLLLDDLQKVTAELNEKIKEG